MRSMLLLAWRYTRYYWGRTAILVAVLTITCYLPLATHWSIQLFERQATLRAAQTPLVVGAQGSRFGLVMHALYFRGESPPAIPQSELRSIQQSQLAQAIPIHARYRARGVPVVGTTQHYFQWRGLTIERGQTWQRLGDCVVGHAAAARLHLNPGDRLLTEPEGLLNLSGPAPFNMRVTGILSRTGTADDDAVLCELKTTWLIAGIGHGHTLDNQRQPDDPSAEQSDSQSDSQLEAETQHQHAAGREYLQQYQEVNDENLHTFHFHGRSSQYPLTAIIAIADSEKSATLLEGKYFEPDQVTQIVRPIDVIEELMQVIGRVRQMFDIGIIGLSLATGLLVALVLMLSIRLREREMQTMYLLGCSRGTIAGIVCAEWAIVITSSLILATLLAWGTLNLFPWIVVHML
ncbi:MAG: hypothetical protein KF752_03605 [Pirellulaceae bacterium]|nr:hypothetical protein [Pirellulaceae bacterium]